MEEDGEGFGFDERLLADPGSGGFACVSDCLLGASSQHLSRMGVPLCEQMNYGFLKNTPRRAILCFGRKGPLVFVV